MKIESNVKSNINFFGLTNGLELKIIDFGMFLCDFLESYKGPCIKFLKFEQENALQSKGYEVILKSVYRKGFLGGNTGVFQEIVSDNLILYLSFADLISKQIFKPFFMPYHTRDGNIGLDLIEFLNIKGIEKNLETLYLTINNDLSVMSLQDFKKKYTNFNKVYDTFPLFFFIPKPIMSENFKLNFYNPFFDNKSKIFEKIPNGILIPLLIPTFGEGQKRVGFYYPQGFLGFLIDEAIFNFSKDHLIEQKDNNIIIKKKSGEIEKKGRQTPLKPFLKDAVYRAPNLVGFIFITKAVNYSIEMLSLAKGISSTVRREEIEKKAKKKVETRQSKHLEGLSMDFILEVFEDMENGFYKIPSKFREIFESIFDPQQDILIFDTKNKKLIEDFRVLKRIFIKNFSKRNLKTNKEILTYYHVDFFDNEEMINKINQEFK